MRRAQQRVLRDAVGRLQRARLHVGQREVRDRVAVGLEHRDGVVAGDDPPSSQLDAHAPAQRLGVRKPGGRRSVLRFVVTGETRLQRVGELGARAVVEGLVVPVGRERLRRGEGQRVRPPHRPLGRIELRRVPDEEPALVLEDRTTQ